MLTKTSDRNPELAASLDVVSHSLNALGSGATTEATTVEFFARLHRTLQQQFVQRIIIPVLRQLATSYAVGAYDLRNEASARLAAKMLAAVSEDDLHLPYN